jgi:hypothetical protein
MKQKRNGSLSMFLKWQKKTKGTSLATYIGDCIGGYPKGSRLDPSLLKSRVMRVKTALAVPDAEVTTALKLISDYKQQLKQGVTDAKQV